MRVLQARNFRSIPRDSMVYNNHMRIEDLARTLENLDEEYHLIVVMEDFLGAGYRNNDNKNTIKILGYIEYLCKYYGYEYYIQPPQFRKPYLEEAQEYFKTYVDESPVLKDSWKNKSFSRHMVDALAHAVGRFHVLARREA